MQEYIAQLRVPGANGTPIEIRPPENVPQGGEGMLEKILSLGIQVFLIVVIIAALFYLIWAGIRWAQSGGDSSKLQAARQQIVFAIIGIVVAFLGFAVITFMGGIFGISLL